MNNRSENDTPFLDATSPPLASQAWTSTGFGDTDAHRIQRQNILVIRVQTTCRYFLPLYGLL